MKEKDTGPSKFPPKNNNQVAVPTPTCIHVVLYHPLATDYIALYPKQRSKIMTYHEHGRMASCMSRIQ
jgi:hypothetical protein